MNLVLIKAPIQLEIALHHPLAPYSQVEINEINQFLCLIISSLEQQNQEKDYFQSVLGFSSSFQFISSTEKVARCIAQDLGADLFHIE